MRCGFHGYQFDITITHKIHRIPTNLQNAITLPESPRKTKKTLSIINLRHCILLFIIFSLNYNYEIRKCMIT